MASVIIGNTYIDYSLIDGRVRIFELDGKLLYDEYEKISTDNWEKKLIEYCIGVGLDNGLVRRQNERGFYMFVLKLVADGKMELANTDIDGKATMQEILRQNGKILTFNSKKELIEWANNIRKEYNELQDDL